MFLPALTLAVVAVLVATFWKSLGANNAIGVSALIALIVALCLFKEKPSTAIKDGTRLLDNVGPTGLLPQVLSALGALCILAITLPLMFRLGVEKGRLAMFLVIFLVCGGTGVIASITVSGDGGAFAFQGPILIVMSIAALVLTAVSIPLSQ